MLWKSIKKKREKGDNWTIKKVRIMLIWIKLLKCILKMYDSKYIYYIVLCRQYDEGTKMHTCTPKGYAIWKCSMSDVTKVFTRTITHKYQKGMGTKKKKYLSTKVWYIKYQAYTAINKIYERVTEANTHQILKLYAIKQKKYQGIFLWGELKPSFIWDLQECYTINIKMPHKLITQTQLELIKSIALCRHILVQPLACSSWVRIFKQPSAYAALVSWLKRNKHKLLHTVFHT